MTQKGHYSICLPFLPPFSLQFGNLGFFLFSPITLFLISIGFILLLC